MVNSRYILYPALRALAYDIYTGLLSCNWDYFLNFYGINATKNAFAVAPPVPNLPVHVASLSTCYGQGNTNCLIRWEGEDVMEEVYTLLTYHNELWLRLQGEIILSSSQGLHECYLFLLVQKRQIQKNQIRVNVS